MIVLLSPAKKLNYEKEVPTNKGSEPGFLPESEKLIHKLKKLSPRKIGKLMNVSDAIAELNFNRYAEWELPFDQSKTRQAMFAFYGEVYWGLEAYTMSEEEIDTAQEHVRILSGLYGLLKPLDEILPYRLEMGSKFGVQRAKDLYQFWGDKITDEINNAIATQSDDLVINLASNEYYKSVKPDKIKGRIITCTFNENKNGQYKAIMTFAKRARGLMTRYIVANKVDSLDGLKAFDTDGYLYNEQLTEGDNFVFTRG